MNHCGTQRLETNRLLLRRLTEADAEAMYRNWASDPEVTRFYDLADAYGCERHKIRDRNLVAPV